MHVHAGFFAQSSRFRRGVGGEGNDRNLLVLRMGEAVELGRFQAAQARHIDIDEGGIEQILFQQMRLVTRSSTMTILVIYFSSQTLVRGGVPLRDAL